MTQRKSLVARCEKCGWFLFGVRFIAVAEESDVMIELQTKCPNKKCTEHTEKGYHLLRIVDDDALSENLVLQNGKHDV